jgi:hypothetical protein
MLQLQVLRRRGTSSLKLSRLQSRQGRDAKERVVERNQGYNRKGVLSQPQHYWTLRGGPAHQQQQQQQQPHPPGCRGLPRHSGRTVCPSSLKHNQRVPSQSVQVLNAKRSPLNDMLKVFATVFQQIMTKLNGAESEEHSILHKSCTKLMKKKS